ncbi:heterokaryon incompatibility protein-domain-containing protein [Boeremia exigua]|uniref:heterokaryon incompatibility protein-domain-containing protein n=1 Tax=Boeremia exigua TaxID=749465 RepID=UPI001E8EA1BD|nr:heterokaryon incompatibility protein-domain-containing protein [Boeremia exigua]KAH6638301.1 heterokaryon incompatibility protein-domain-containing protein [Boeremia exigua]
MKLCDYCIANVLESDVSWDFHNHSYDALTPSSKYRCLFCSTLRKDIRRVAPWLKESDYAESWPVYRWSIRSLAKIRESPETAVVTFRYVPPKKRLAVGVDADLDNIDLPTRTFFLFPDEDLQPLPTLLQLGRSTNPSVNGGRQIREWVGRCDQQHTDCMRRRKATPKASRFIPTRLLDISGPPESAIRVIETATTTVHGPYCSLSHCWGKPDFVQLRDNNRKSFMTDGVSWNMLTNNFRQAIEVARFLEIGYIWIDSLCIIQGSAEDWVREASKMHLVYRNSYCNIAIADSVGQYGGAFRSREPMDVSPVEYTPREASSMFTGKKWRVVPEDLWDRELLQSSLYTRGWVFQERMLSPRILHFTRGQVFWDCPSLSACESLPAGLPKPMDKTSKPDRHWRGRLQEPEGSRDLAGPNDQPLSVYWQSAVRNYTSCNLTQRSDKLIALWGIAKLIKDSMGVEYGEGLWEDNLEDQLAWRVAECKLKERPVTERRKIPSWSWASMDGEIIIADRLSDKSHRTVCDHNGRDLELDLKGVKRYARPSLPSRPRGPGPFLPQRVQSDSVLEVKHAKTKAQKDIGHYGQGEKADKVDENAEPVLHNYAIAIQGHINHGILRFSETRRAWVLRVHDENNFEMEAYPDTIPSLMNGEHPSKFVVLSVKKVVKLKAESMQTHGSGDIEFEGRGILLESVDKEEGDRFRRVGAFDFRGANAETFSRLLVTAGSEKLPPQEYSARLGRKFWLE